MSNTPIEVNQIRHLVPLNVLNETNLGNLLTHAEMKQAPAGTVLFKPGELDKRTIYLIAGELELNAKGKAHDDMLCAGDEAAGHPVAPCQPRQHKAVAKTDVMYLSIDSGTLDIMLTWDQEASSYEVTEETDDDIEQSDWMMRMLNNQAFYDVPPANIHTVFTRMEAMDLAKGDTVIKQGDAGDFFYAVQSGRCEVIRETPRHPEGVHLADLSPGDSFGEEALISNKPRNATVRMLTDGVLMRLDKGDFISLLTSPTLDYIDLAQAKDRVAKGAQWLDVRLPSEFAKMHIKGSVNIPLYFLRQKIGELDASKDHVVVCDTGSRSSAATFLLMERGFKAAVLEGGLSRAAAKK